MLNRKQHDQSTGNDRRQIAEGCRDPQRRNGHRIYRLGHQRAAGEQNGAKGEVDAVVFDAPVLIYDTANNKNSEFEIVSELFDKQDYGLVLQDGSILRESVNRAVLLIQESGYYDTLYKKWFGENK